MRATQLLISFILILSATNTVAEDKVNPNYVFFSSGDTPDGWHWVISDPGNWWLPLEGNTGESDKRKVKMEPTTFRNEGDAVKVTWNKKQIWGSVAITGRTTDLSKYENSAELSMVVKLHKKPRSLVKISLNCGKDCNAEFPLTPALKNAPLNQWFALPVALNCFSAKGADLSKVQTPLNIGTDGKLELSIADVKILPLKEGEKGCMVTEEEGATKKEQEK